jgi:hypothetical protein
MDHLRQRGSLLVLVQFVNWFDRFQTRPVIFKPGSVCFQTFTPKALANCSPGLLQPWAHIEVEEETLKAFDRVEPFQG